MTLHTIYSFGYQGFTPQQLEQFVRQHNAVVVDTRFMPASRDARWAKGNLARQLGEAYQHFKEFGNKNYKSAGPIELVDFEAGFKRLIPLLEAHDVVLMCACWNRSDCHRTAVLKEVVKRTGANAAPLLKSDIPKIEVAPDQGSLPF